MPSLLSAREDLEPVFLFNNNLSPVEKRRFLKVSAK